MPLLSVLGHTAWCCMGTEHPWFRDGLQQWSLCSHKAHHCPAQCCCWKCSFPVLSRLCHPCCTACAKNSWHRELQAPQLLFLDVLCLNWPFLNPVMGWVHHSSQFFKTQPAQSNVIMKPSSFWRWNHRDSTSKWDAAAPGKCWVCAFSPGKILACMLFIKITTHWNAAGSAVRSVEWMPLSPDCCVSAGFSREGKSVGSEWALNTELTQWCLTLSRTCSQHCPTSQTFQRHRP